MLQTLLLYIATINTEFEIKMKYLTFLLYMLQFVSFSVWFQAFLEEILRFFFSSLIKHYNYWKVGDN